jgi:hypothetical protein
MWGGRRRAACIGTALVCSRGRGHSTRRELRSVEGWSLSGEQKLVVWMEWSRPSPTRCPPSIDVERHARPPSVRTNLQLCLR